MTDRVLGAVLVGLGLAAIVVALGWDVRFQGDPVGPKPFPMLAGALLAASGAVVALLPGGRVAWPAPRRLLVLMAATAGLIAYALALRPIGFLPATAIVLTAGALVFGASVGRAIVLGLAGASVIWALIEHGLDIPLPAGLLS
ncbi:MAG: tripartite tricarboxylate transporter TctB family protein [Acetobacteraceae bacterium]|nr:tripartite tricarboxylate transporter TctB family protein [Acetobacteraceae bacterium]